MPSVHQSNLTSCAVASAVYRRSATALSQSADTVGTIASTKHCYTCNSDLCPATQGAGSVSQ